MLKNMVVSSGFRDTVIPQEPSKKSVKSRKPNQIWRLTV